MFTLSTGSEVGFCIGFALTTVSNLCVTFVSGAKSTSVGTCPFDFSGAGAGASLTAAAGAGVSFTSAAGAGVSFTSAAGDGVSFTSTSIGVTSITSVSYTHLRAHETR